MRDQLMLVVKCGYVKGMKNMNKYVLNNSACGVLGTLEQQFSSINNINDTLEKMFGEKVIYFSLNNSPFFAYNEAGEAAVIKIEGQPVLVSVKQQGFLATYRHSVIRSKNNLRHHLESRALEILGSELYEGLFTCNNWAKPEVIRNIQEARQ